MSFQRHRYSLKKNPRTHREWKRLEAALEAPCPWCRQVGKRGLSTRVEKQFWFRQALCPRARPPVSQTHGHGECRGSPQLSYRLLPTEDLGLLSRHREKRWGFQCFSATVERPWGQGNRGYSCFARLTLRSRASTRRAPLTRSRFAAIGIRRVYPHQAAALAPSIPAEVAPGLDHLTLPQLGPCDSPGRRDGSWRAVLAGSRPPRSLRGRHAPLVR